MMMKLTQNIMYRQTPTQRLHNIVLYVHNQGKLPPGIMSVCVLVHALTVVKFTTTEFNSGIKGSVGLGYSHTLPL